MLIESDDEFGITVTSKDVIGFLFEIGTNGIVVIELAIDNSVQRIGLGMERLKAVRGEVIDSKTDVTEGYYRSGQYAWNARKGEMLRVGGPTRLSGLIHWPRESGPRCLI